MVINQRMFLLIYKIITISYILRQLSIFRLIIPRSEFFSLNIFKSASPSISKITTWSGISINFLAKYSAPMLHCQSLIFPWSSPSKNKSQILMFSWIMYLPNSKSKHFLRRRQLLLELAWIVLTYLDLDH